ncbi:uncharacterized protein JN550_010383 [Neoarthrinium moseri]|uniref:uncharacterized protein n=1 Tax=Neoarthrinium moseri TaxID=1658444 RepID=UPI001FDB8EBC|nr:uncharacterized protein JN550_010383 [Neoarthrinium moseri]KAI1862227.1 hypothetical protein JN550_010383 [Neoarthrinium moseri]
MENTPPPRPISAGAANGQIIPVTAPAPAPAAAHTQNRKRSGSGGGILSKFPFMRTAESKSNLRDARHIDIAQDALNRPPRPDASSPDHQQPLKEQQQQQQQQQTRRRKGSLRKVALLGRGAQRDRREPRPLDIDTAATSQPTQAPPPAKGGIVTTASELVLSPAPMDSPGLGLGISDVTPRPSMDGYARRAEMPTHPPPPVPSVEPQMTSPSISYTSTTDEEDILSIKQHNPSPLRPGLASLSSGSESYFKPARAPSLSLQRRRSIKHAKSPLSLQGLSPSPLPVPVEEYDYSETEWWGWVILIVTWVVFVTGMGSCLGVWSWAWDVGTTPYAPPEFEDDPTLPIVGYYPSLLILTCIMAWVWVVTAWVGMKYFRHAKISGD